MALAFALFFAVANAAETYEASEKITQQVLSGELSQTVYAGDEIKPITILYENTGLAENVVPEYSSTNFLENFGLSKRWTKGPACEIAGEMIFPLVRTMLLSSSGTMKASSPRQSSSSLSWKKKKRCL
jgi:hypothetical protein